MEGYDDIVSEILINLSDNALRSRPISAEDVLEDDQLDVPQEYFEGDRILEPRQKYSSDEAAVYVFRSPGGLELVGNKAMIDMSLPDRLPSIYNQQAELD